MKRINVQGFGLVDFPDYMTDDQIAHAIETSPSFKSQQSSQADIGYWSNVGRGVANRAVDLTGNLLGFVDTIADAIPFKDQGLVWGDGGGLRWANTDEWSQLNPSDIGDLGDQLVQQDFGYQPRHTWESTKQAEGFFPSIAEGAKYIGEAGPQSIADMVGAFASPVPYIASRSQEIGDKRAKNKGMDSAGAQEVLEAVPTAVIVQLLERLLPASLPNIAGKGMVKGAGIGAVTEAGTEAIQEGGVEYLGERLGTGAELSVSEALDRALGASLVGGGVGAPMGAIGGSLGNKQESQKPPNQSIAEQIIDSLSQDEFIGADPKQDRLINTASNEGQKINLPSIDTSQYEGQYQDIVNLLPESEATPLPTDIASLFANALGGSEVVDSLPQQPQAVDQGGSDIPPLPEGFTIDQPNAQQAQANDTLSAESKIKSAMPESISSGMAVIKPKPIGGTLYREMSEDSFNSLLSDSFTNSQEEGSVAERFVTDDPNLALGQGDNQGVFVELDGDYVSGQKANSKPGAEFVEGNEFVSDYMHRNAIKRVRVPKSLKLNWLGKTFFRRHFDKITDEGDYAVYGQKGLAMPDTPLVQRVTDNPTQVEADAHQAKDARDTIELINDQPQKAVSERPAQELRQSKAGLKEPEKPKILRSRINTLVKQRIKKQKIDESDPDHEQQVDRIKSKVQDERQVAEEQYERELEKFEASLSFNEFKDRNKGSESMLREAYRQLREEYGFDDNSTQEEANAGIPTDQESGIVEDNAQPLHQETDAEPAVNVESADQRVISDTGDSGRNRTDTPTQVLPATEDVAERSDLGLESTDQTVETPIESSDNRSLDDFGEKIGGSRKDLAALQKLFEPADDREIASKPLSKTWPKKDIDNIEDVRIAAFATAARMTIPNKPRMKGKVNRWVEKVQSLRELVSKVLDDGSTDRILEMMRKASGLSDLATLVEVMSEVDRDLWPRLGEITVYKDAFSFDFDNRDENGEAPKIPKPHSYVMLDGKRVRAEGLTDKDALVDFVKDKLAGDAPTKQKNQLKFEIRRNLQNPDDSQYYLNKKGDREYTPLKYFGSAKEAREYRESNYDDLVAAWEAVKERENVTKADMRNKENRPRVGADHRDGKDVTPEMFTEAFGFRGVEFGNWLKQGKGAKDRQGMLNKAYDALIDMASILDIPTKGISLNGELGLALGARGRGKWAAHYEPDFVVINLTKTQGAGSLAHEWFHALDNYFQKKRGTPRSWEHEDQFITHAPETYYENPMGYRLSESKFNSDQVNITNRDEWKKVEGVRPEMAAMWVELVKAIKQSPMHLRAMGIDGGKKKGYWSSTLEMAARSFENYIIQKMQDQGYHNDFLANVRGIDSFERNPEKYPYLTDEELPPVAEAFDQLFEVMESKETDQGVMLYSKPDNITTDGLSTDEAQKVIDQFLSTFKGAADISLHLSDDSGAWDGGRPAQAGFNPRTNRLFIAARSHADTRELQATLRHEIFVHKGLGLFKPDQVKQLLAAIKAAENTDKEIAEIWSDVRQRYDDKSEIIQAEEVLAKIAETDLTRSKKWINDILVAVRRFLQRIGLINRGVNKRDLINIVQEIGQAFKDGRRAKARDASAFESRNESVKRNFDLDQQDSPTIEVNVTFGDEGGGLIPPNNQPPVDEYSRGFESLGGKDKSLVSKAKNLLKREFTPGGLLPNSVFKEKIARDSEIQELEFDTQHRLAFFDNAIQQGYGKPYKSLSDAQKAEINEVLADKSTNANIPTPVNVELIKMRQAIKSLSRDYAAYLENQIEQLSDGDTKDARQSLLDTILNNMDSYLHRSYRAFDDPSWPKKVPRPVYDRAVSYLKNQYGSVDQAVKAAELILEQGTAFDNIESFIAESKLGAKDLSVLKRRKEIAEPIRALLGEYQDARINYTKTVTKMGRLVFNQRFLDKIRDIGLSEGFLFEKESRELDATRKIAADQSEVYAPLNGLYTFPEIEQAFKDALGKEQMADWYRMVIRLNGMVKYGKTVLSPTTAARNWMSAALFAMANGHFDLTQIKQSISSVRRSARSENRVAYLKKLKRLGVVYDTPYAGEMMDLMRDAQLESTLFDSKPVAGLKKAGEMATRFYQYGDDFWKIVGFENEKALLMKHKDLTESQAEKEAAERVRNTYPTYSMIGRFVQHLRRFPLAGTFVSFPAEIIRTSYHILRYAKQDMKDNPILGIRRLTGLAFVSGAVYALQSLSKQLLGIDDDEEEAIRVLAAPWAKNSNLLFVGREADGSLRYLDMSYLDPYNYWKRPLNAIMRGQPAENMIKDVFMESFTPFFGQDIAFGTLMETINNKKESGGQVFNESDTTFEQSKAIANHIRKGLQPGIAANAERMAMALTGKVSSSGRQYQVDDELMALAGFRVSTLDFKTSLYYRSFEYKDKMSGAAQIVNKMLRDPNAVSDSELKSAYERAVRQREKTFADMQVIVNAVKGQGYTDQQIKNILKASRVSQKDAIALVNNAEMPIYKPSKTALTNAMKKSDVLYTEAQKAEIRRRFQRLQALSSKE